jgi:Trk K+ transport system NAD-binding subunit
MLTIFERKHADREAAFDNGEMNGRPDIIILGLGRYGMAIAQNLHNKGSRVLGIDIDPEVVRTCAGKDIDVRFGDAEDPEFLDTLTFQYVDWIVCTAREREISLSFLKTLHNSSYGGKTAVTAATAADALVLEGAGADRVLRPFLDAAQQAADDLSADLSPASDIGQQQQLI